MMMMMPMTTSDDAGLFEARCRGLGRGHGLGSGCDSGIEGREVRGADVHPLVPLREELVEVNADARCGHGLALGRVVVDGDDGPGKPSVPVVAGVDAVADVKVPEVRGLDEAGPWPLESRGIGELDHELVEGLDAGVA